MPPAHDRARVGVLTALTFKSAVNDPGRFRSSKMVGAHFGLTPSKHQSGEKDVTGAITRAGDGMARSTLYEAATALLTRTKAFSSLKNWGLAVARRRGRKRATVAVARKLAVILHRMLTDRPSALEERHRLMWRLHDELEMTSSGGA